MASKYFIDVDELHNSLKHTILIDPRPPSEYANGHISGAHNIHDCFTYLLSSSDEKGLHEFQSKFRDLFESIGITGKPGEQVVTYEDGLSSCFAMSCRAAFILRYLGHPNVRVLNGGLQAWAGKHSVTKDVPTATRSTFEGKIDSSLICDKQAVVDAIEKKNRVLLDVRDKPEWIGVSSSPYGPDFVPRKGRLPGAVWLEWYRLMAQDDKNLTFIKSDEEVKKIAESVGIKPSDDIIIYCFKGSRVSNTLFLLRAAGFSNTVNYFGSWNEWARDPSLPIDATVLSD